MGRHRPFSFHSPYVMRSRGGTVTYETEADALFTRMTSAGATPDATRKSHINTLILALKTATVWTKLDLLYVMAAHAQSVAVLNWTSASFPLTEVNTPTFTVDRGYTFNGTTQECTCTYDASGDGVQFQRNAHHLGAFTLTAGTSTGYDFGETTGTLAGVRSRTGTNGTVRCQSSSALAGAAGGAQPLHTLGVRPGASDVIHYRNGESSNSTAANASSAASTNTWGVGRAISLYSDRQVAICHNGTTLDATAAAATYNAFLAYLQAVGAA